jgi:hypothetical protein
MSDGEMMREARAVRGPGAAGGDAGDSGTLDDIRELADRFLRASDEAIERALSRDSQEFLRASRQEGGQ